jgi:hypothetical protein
MMFSTGSGRGANQSGESKPSPSGSRGQRDHRPWFLHRGFRSFSSVAVWIFVIAASAVLVTSRGSLPGCGKSSAVIERDNSRASRRDLERYSARYIEAVRRAVRERRDLLESYATFQELWQQVSPDEPMKLQMISPIGRDSESREVIPAVIRPPVAVDEQNFEEYWLVLTDLRTLILEENSTGRGLLRATHFDAEPAADWLPDVRPTVPTTVGQKKANTH